MEIESLDMGMPCVQELMKERRRLQVRVTELESELVRAKLAQKAESEEGTCSGVEHTAVAVRETRLGKRVWDCSQRELGEIANDESKKRFEELENGLKSMQEKVKDLEVRNDAAVRNLSEDKEKELLHKRILELEDKKLALALALEIQCLKDGDVTLKKKMEAIQYYNEEMKKMQQAAHDCFLTVSAEHEKARQNLEAQKRELEEQEAQLQQRENESERRRLDNEKKMNELATQEQKMAEERMSKLADEQKKEKEKLHERILLLERTLDEKQALELEIQSLKGSLDVMKRMAEDRDITLKKKMEAIQEEMKEKQENYDALDELSSVLMIRERRTNDELQELRKVLIKGFSEFKARPDIGIKRMGELDGKPFHAVAKTKFSDEDKATEWAATMSLAWEEHLRDQSWHPFKVLQDEGNYRRG